MGAAAVLDPTSAVIEYPHGSVGDEVGARAAVTALLNAEGNVIDALRALGLDIQAMSMAEIQAAALRTFQRDRVKALLLEQFDNVDLQKPKLIARMVDIALHGNDEAAVRAFISLSKVAGWIAATKVEVNSKTLNIHALLNDPAGVKAALEALSHEPGEALAIEDETARLAISAGRGEGDDAGDSDDDDPE